jgi:hypothetical protein
MNVYNLGQSINFFNSLICTLRGCLTMEFARVANLLDVQMKGINYCDVEFIAGLHNSAKVWVSYT